MDLSNYEVVELEQKSTTKRKVLAAGAALLLGAGAYGVFASGLSFSTSDNSPFNAGASVISDGCQTAAITTTLTGVTYNTTSDIYEADGVQVGNVDAGCVPGTMDIQGLDDSNAEVASGSVAAATPTTSFTGMGIPLGDGSGGTLDSWAVVIY